MLETEFKFYVPGSYGNSDCYIIEVRAVGSIKDVFITRNGEPMRLVPYYDRPTVKLCLESTDHLCKHWNKGKCNHPNIRKYNLQSMLCPAPLHGDSRDCNWCDSDDNN